MLADRNPQFVALSDGGIRNGYTIKLVNKTEVPRFVRLKVSGIDGIQTTLVGIEGVDPVIEIPVADVRAIKLFATVPNALRSKLNGGSTKLDITVIDTTTGVNKARSTSFRSPDGDEHHDKKHEGKDKIDRGKKDD